MSIHIELSNGVKMPLIGLGTYELNGNTGIEAVQVALQTGYRALDAAWLYNNQEEIGEAIANAVNTGVVRREELFITTKVSPQFYDSQESIKENCRYSLSKLRLQYVDLLLLHAPWAVKKVEGDTSPTVNGKCMTVPCDLAQVWKGMETCMDQGLTKAIGVSNFNSKQLQLVLDNARIRPVVNQVECHIYQQQKKLQSFMAERGVVMISYGCLGSPGRNNPDKSDIGLQNMLEHSVVKSIGERHGKLPSQVCLRFLIQSGIAVIPKSATPARIKSNFDICDFALNAAEMDSISEMHSGKRVFTFDNVKHDANYPFHDEF
ncbi:PREDICTED: 1,5-anhydro-D-fructose reductase-like [Priapulus caudatus]|uniref:1,5-anhydro-D-fructose reductase-like n=1 Tax=Priapulus caudatus TaxID=37621 RepID=A0ABM1E0H9_PRICU|nr:PREDICTED: 1,5-anhydro-D-fructose reductase-like [Priapulus caudatus]